MFISFLLVSIAILVALYVFKGLALSNAAEIEGIDNKFFAWIPVLNIVILLKIANKEVKYIWLFIATIILNFFNENTDSVFLTFFSLVLSIYMIVIQLQIYLAISNKYNINISWFIIGIFFHIFILVGYIILYNRVKKLKNEGFTEDIINQDVTKRRNKILLNSALILIGINLAIIIVPFIIAFIFPSSGFGQVGWVFTLIGIYLIPIAFIFFIFLAIALFIYYKREKNK